MTRSSAATSSGFGPGRTQVCEHFSSVGKARSDCLGVVVFFALVPLAGFLMVQAYVSG